MENKIIFSIDKEAFMAHIQEKGTDGIADFPKFIKHEFEAIGSRCGVFKDCPAGRQGQDFCKNCGEKLETGKNDLPFMLAAMAKRIARIEEKLS